MMTVICRCCLIENPNLTYNIFDKDLDVQVKLIECVPNLILSPKDGLPENICDACWLRVCAATEFQRNCIASDRELRTVLGQTVKGDVYASDGEPTAFADMNAFKENANSLQQWNSNEETQNEFEFSTLANLLLEDNLFNSLPDTDVLNANQSIRINEDDPAMIELVDRMLNDPVFQNFDDIQDNSNSGPSSPTFVIPQTPKTRNKSSKSKTEHSVEQQSARPLKALHSCSECQKQFTRNFQLKLHMISVHNVGKGLHYSCEVCRQTFASRHSLSCHHKSEHSVERPFSCEQCTRSFELQTQLVAHMRIHTSETRCEQCGKRWPTKGHLRTHMRSHESPQLIDRTFKCDRCAKTFNTRAHLNAHLLVHNSEKPFACKYCHRSYNTITNLNSHMLRRHTDIILASSPD